MTPAIAQAVARVLALRKSSGPDLAKRFPELADALEVLAKVTKASTR